MRIPSIPQVYRNVNRWREIIAVLSKYGLADWISRLDLSFAKGLFKNRDGEVLAKHSRETRVRLAIEDLGAAFIKLGQILSTRPDLVGPALAEELGRLQTDVPSDSPHVVRQTVERELGQPLAELFAEFDERPFASASIGQVHRARLKSGEDVVVKVQHGGVDERVRVDMDILAGLAQLAERIPELAYYRPQSTAAEFQRAMCRELDFLREQRNMARIARDLAGVPWVLIPRAYPSLSTARVLTMQYVSGTKLSEVMTGTLLPAEGNEFARRGAELYMEMIFQHGFYHADPHPGNIVLLPGSRIGLLDFGMVGRIEESLREEIEEMLQAIVAQDAAGLAAVIVRVGAVPTDFDECQLRLDVEDFVAHYAHQPMDQLDLSAALAEVIEIIRRYHILLPAQLAILLKVLIMLEGTGRRLSPQFSLMEVMSPYQQRMARRRLSPRRQLKKMQRIAYEVEQLAELFPRRMREILHQVQTGKFDVHLDHRGLEPSVNRLVLGMLASALFIGSSLLMSREIWPVYGVSVPGFVGALISFALGIRLLRAISKSGRLDRRP
jgi:ubiquinone biosynthesis protein